MIYIASLHSADAMEFQIQGTLLMLMKILRIFRAEEGVEM